MSEIVKAAVVTGGSSGIGQGIAVVLAEHGYDIAITYGKNPEGAEKTREVIEKMGRRCFVYQASLEKADVPAKLINDAYRDLGRIDVLVNNAGRDSRNSVLTATAEDLDYIYSTNFRGYMLCAGAAARHMVKDKIRGSIIFITSSRAERAYPDDFIYGGIKAAVKRACESLAIDLAPFGIRVNCVAPGATRVRNIPVDINENPEEYEKIANAADSTLARAIPLKRKGTPRENGELVAFLASDNATYITGVTVRVDGGLILPGIPEWGCEAEWLNPAWTEKQYKAVMESDN